MRSRPAWEDTIAQYSGSIVEKEAENTAGPDFTSRSTIAAGQKSLTQRREGAKETVSSSLRLWVRLLPYHRPIPCSRPLTSCGLPALRMALHPKRWRRSEMFAATHVRPWG
jgi:hypothetical protein